MKKFLLATTALFASTTFANACSLSGPDAIKAGIRFNVTAQASSATQIPASIVRVNLDGSESEPFAAINDFGVHTVLVSSTNWAGPHIIRMKLANGSKCETTVTFQNPPAGVSCFRGIIAIGQSDERNRGEGPFSDPLQNPAFDALIRQVNLDGTKLVPIGYLDQTGVMWDGLQFPGAPEGWIGMGNSLSVARQYVRYNMPTNCNAVIIPVAVGLTCIEDWTNYSGHIYQDFLTRLNYFFDLSPDSKIILILWQQGNCNVAKAISDPNNALSPSEYQAALPSFWGRLRTDAQALSAPIVGGCFTPHWCPPGATGTACFNVKHAYCSAIENALSSSPPSAEVAMNGITANIEMGYSGGWHMSASSQVTLFAPRAYNGFLTATSQKKWHRK